MNNAQIIQGNEIHIDNNKVNAQFNKEVVNVSEDQTFPYYKYKQYYYPLSINDLSLSTTGSVGLLNVLIKSNMITIMLRLMKITVQIDYMNILNIMITFEVFGMPGKNNKKKAENIIMNAIQDIIYSL